MNVAINEMQMFNNMLSEQKEYFKTLTIMKYQCKVIEWRIKIDIIKLELDMHKSMINSVNELNQNANTQKERSLEKIYDLHNETKEMEINLNVIYDKIYQYRDNKYNDEIILGEIEEIITKDLE